MTRQTIDLELIRKIKDGDKKAEIKIYNYYRDKVTRFIFKKYPTNTYIEDNVSEILIKVFENIDKYSNNRANFNTWVLTIAKNHMLDGIKKMQPIYTNFVSSGGDITLANNNVATCSTFTYNGEVMSFSEPMSLCTSSPDYSIQINDSMGQIASTVSCSDYSMLSMKYIDGYNYNEIGMEFNLTSEEVSNKINYNKKKISKKFKEE